MKIVVFVKAESLSVMLVYATISSITDCRLCQTSIFSSKLLWKPLFTSQTPLSFSFCSFIW